MDRENCELAWSETVMIAWFMTSAAEVVIMHCCAIKTHREIHIGHFTSQCHLSHWVILWSRTQGDIPSRRWVECSVQRGNEICLFLPDRWPVSSRDSLHSALRLLCPATVVPSFLITGIYCSSGFLPMQISQQKACGDTERDFWVRKPSQLCSLPGHSHRDFFFF